MMENPSQCQTEIDSMRHETGGVDENGQVETPEIDQNGQPETQPKTQEIIESLKSQLEVI